MPRLVSFLIPARNEIYLEKTVRNILENIRGDSEVLVGLDGWIPDPQIHFNDERVRVFHYPVAVGHRAVTNNLAREAQGKFVCKIDAHCSIGEGFDVILSQDCEYDWTVIPRMWNLDTETWTPRYFDDWRKAVRQRKVHDYLYIYINERGELRTQYYPSHINKVMHHERKDILIDETMSCMGPCFFMHQGRYWELGGCDEKHEGGWGQQAIELACKAWLSGGKLMVNKKTWFAHWFRGGQGWPYPISGRQIDRCRAYSKDLWLNDKWPLAKRKFMWLVEKFNPPGWDKKESPEEKLKDIERREKELEVRVDGVLKIEKELGKLTSDKTVIYYTSQRENQSFEDKIKHDLRSKINGTPIISVSQKPISFGNNICVGDVGTSTSNAIRQLQLGALKATTKYICTAESDTIYPSDYFMFVPPRDDTFYLADPCYVIFALKGKEKSFYKKPFGSEGMMVCNREFLLKLLEIKFKDRPEWTIDDCIPFNLLDGQKVERFKVSVPIVVFKTDRNMHRRSPVFLSSRIRELKGIGTSDELLRKFR